MAVLLVTYDLNREAGSKVDYNKFYKVRDTYDYVRLSESSYAFNTTESTDTVKAKIQGAFDANDYVWIIPLKRPYSGYGLKTTIAWLDKNLPSS